MRSTRSLQSIQLLPRHGINIKSWFSNATTMTIVLGVAVLISAFIIILGIFTLIWSRQRKRRDVEANDPPSKEKPSSFTSKADLPSPHPRKSISIPESAYVRQVRMDVPPRSGFSPSEMSETRPNTPARYLLPNSSSELLETRSNSSSPRHLPSNPRANFSTSHLPSNPSTRSNSPAHYPRSHSPSRNPSLRSVSSASHLPSNYPTRNPSLRSIASTSRLLLNSAPLAGASTHYDDKTAIPWASVSRKESFSKIRRREGIVRVPSPWSVHEEIQEKREPDTELPHRLSRIIAELRSEYGNM